MPRKVPLKTALGNIRAHTSKVFEEIAGRWSIWYAWGIGATGHHKEGRALDFMTLTENQKSLRDDVGNAIAAYCQSNSKRLGVEYIIFRQRIWNATRTDDKARTAWSSWRKMEDRGNPTANHMDHVHLSLLDKPPTYTAPTGGAVPAPAQKGNAMRTAAQAVAAARAESSRSTRNLYNLCLAFVRTCWGIPATGIYNANAAWTKATMKRTTGTPPAGAPVYWAGGRHGHIAISAGGGKCYSTDIKRQGKVDLVTIATIKSKWGMTYRGWSADYAGRKLPLGGATPPPAKKPHTGKRVDLSQLVAAAKADPKRKQGGTTSGSADDVKIVEDCLKREGLLAAKYATDGSFGSLTVKAYASWQRRLGYTGKDADGIPGMTSLKRMGTKYGFASVA